MLNLGSGPAAPAAGSATPIAIRRLQKDYAKLMTDPVDGIQALPNEDNILEWHYCLRGSTDTPFHGGYYWGKVIFKENFPWSPPAITMITPNGRFATNTRLCLSISDYHPETWNPGWTVSAILIGLHSFMNENQPAAGAVSMTPQEQRNFAVASKEFNVKYREFRRFFPNLVKEWTGVTPTPDEPNVAPVMLPEHATPNGIQVPTLPQHSRGYMAAFGGMEEMMNAFRGAYPHAPPPPPNMAVQPPALAGYDMPPLPPLLQIQPAQMVPVPVVPGAQFLPPPPPPPVQRMQLRARGGNMPNGQPVGNDQDRRVQLLHRFGMARAAPAAPAPAQAPAPVVGRGARRARPPPQNRGQPTPKMARKGDNADNAITLD
ncbi:unnamed protein product [Caenorhabditis sp. 36 PRJEB53466]|nr:unnamed protein product [Caenorhabditis sp. 36 PRJEB53466]